MPKNRDGYWQAVRGICIVAVIWIHSRSGEAYVGAEHGWNGDYWLISRQVIDFPVATFLFLAGYFVHSGRELGPRSWLSRRLPRLMVPFLIWSTLYTGVMLARSREIAPTRLLLNLITGNSAAHLYFIVVLVQLVLLTPLLLKALPGRWSPVLFAVTPLYIVGVYAWALKSGDMPPMYGTWFPAWFSFYYAGLWSRSRGGLLTHLSIAMGATLVAVGLALSVIECYLLVGWRAPYALAISQLKLSSICYAFAVIAFFFSLKRIDVEMPTLLKQLGDDSYGIYFVHLLWLFVVQALISRTGLATAVPVLPIWQVLEVVVALLLSVASVSLTRRVIGPKRATQLLGF